jgi:hypothetical protein
MLTLRTITVDCHDCYQQALWWSKATGWQEDPDDANRPGDPEGRLVSPVGVSLLFMPVPEGKTGKNRMHLDLQPPDDSSRDAEVDRLTGLGAVLVEDHRRKDGGGWVVLADPEGNEFCVEVSAAERERLRVSPESAS